MNYLVVIFPFVLNTANSDSVSDAFVTANNTDSLPDDIVKHFNSNSVKTLRKIWEDHRQSIEQAISTVMQDTIGKDGLNVFTMMPLDLKLTDTYYHKHGSVEMVFKDLNLVQLPYCWLPDASLSLASNVLKIETTLTKMVINAEYFLMRNKSDIIDDKRYQNPYKRSPFLFKQVLNKGQISIVVDGCLLSGYVIARLKGESVDLGHAHFTLKRCEYSVEIYNKDTGIPPVIVDFSEKKPAHSLEIKHFLLRILTDEFKTKLQAIIFSYVNSSAIFGQNLSVFEEEQDMLFHKASSNVTKLIRDQNQRVLNLNGGAVNLTDYYKTWDYWDHSFYKTHYRVARLKLSNMVLTGLATAYNSYTGGPYKLDEAMIGEQIRFNKLQIRGQLIYTEQTDSINFSVEISDYAINIEMDVQADVIQRSKSEVVGYRKIELATQLNVTEAERIIITGYLVDEVSKAIMKTITAVSKMQRPTANDNLSETESIEQPDADVVDESKDIESKISFSLDNSLRNIGKRTRLDAERKKMHKAKRKHNIYKHILNNKVPNE